jgi:hypothetical protein
MQKIWINVAEKSGKFLGAYSSLELALDAGISGVTDKQDVLTMEYNLTSGRIDKQVLTVEDILNGKN